MSDDITEILHAWNAGSTEALEQLVPVVQSELHRLAKKHLRRERSHHTLQPTALLNEAYLRLLKQNNAQWQNREQFFALASSIMRRVLVDYARKRQAVKRGGGHVHVTWNDSMNGGVSEPADVIALHDALNTLSEVDTRQGRIVELIFFGGLTVSETAEILEISSSTVKREWRLAKLFLYHEMRQV